MLGMSGLPLLSTEPNSTILGVEGLAIVLVVVAGDRVSPALKANEHEEPVEPVGDGVRGRPASCAKFTLQLLVSYGDGKTAAPVGPWAVPNEVGNGWKALPYCILEGVEWYACLTVGTSLLKLRGAPR